MSRACTQVLCASLTAMKLENHQAIEAVSRRSDITAFVAIHSLEWGVGRLVMGWNSGGCEGGMIGRSLLLLVYQDC